MLTKRSLRRSKGECICLTLGLVMALATTALAQRATPALSIVEISGRITDASGQAIEKAIVKAVGTDVSPVLTNAEGRYKFYLVGQTEPFTLTLSKEGYVARSSTPITPRRRATFDAVLNPAAPPPVNVVMENFISDQSISGRVTGLNPEDVGRYKVLVYVQTNQWYIHPYAENTPGKGYAKIEAEGSWRIKTVNRGHGPFRLAILVVPRDYIPPATVAAGENAEQSLRSRIGSNLVACQIQSAPEGL